MRGERSQASHVDARGLGPVALGIVLTGIPDELAKIPVMGVTLIAIAVGWAAYMIPGWKRDFTRALKESTAERVLDDGARDRSGGDSNGSSHRLTAATGDSV
jgi:hypothetical protein